MEKNIFLLLVFIFFLLILSNSLAFQSKDVYDSIEEGYNPIEEENYSLFGKNNSFATEYRAEPNEEPFNSVEKEDVINQVKEDEPGLSRISKVEGKVLEIMEEKGSASVIVDLDDSNLVFFPMETLREIVNMNQDAVLSQLSEEEFTIRFRYNVVNAFSGEVTGSGLQKLVAHPLVEAIYDADEALKITLDESIPLINADDVWRIPGSGGYTRGNGQVVCVIDTGIDYTHPDFGGCTTQQFLSGQCTKVIGGWDFYNNDNDPIDDNSHGTHVAGIVAANGGVKGVAPDAKLLAVKVCNEEGGDCRRDYMIAGTDWCINNRLNYDVSVLTMSLGDGGEYGPTAATCPTWMTSSIVIAHILDLPFTIASGNEGHKNGISYPACAPDAISVGMTYDADVGRREFCLNRILGVCVRTCTDETTTADKVVCASNSDEILDVMMPGAIITSTILSGNYGSAIGTSMAAPHVAGTIALMKQYTSNLGVNQILSTLKSTGVPVRDEGNGLTFPRIDALAAVTSSCTTPINGMTITQDTRLCPGVYDLPDGISIGADNIVLDCQGSTLRGISTNTGIYNSRHDNIIIRNCNIQNYQTGILLFSSSNNILTNNDVSSNSMYGIRIVASNNNILENNNVNSNSEYGIYLFASNNNILTNNNANLNDNGIWLESSSNFNTLESNNVNSNNFMGISLLSSNSNTLTSNIANSNSENGIVLHTSNNNILTSNNASSNSWYGITIFQSNNNILTSNTANSNGNYGIWIRYSNDNTLNSNTANSNGFYGGIGLSFSNNSILENNNANSNSQYGIYLESSNSNTLTSNDVDSNNRNGIRLSSSNNNILTNNNANSNYEGISLLSSNNNILTSNIADFSRYGIYLESSNSNTLTSNDANSNTIVGIHLKNSDSNTLNSNNANSTNNDGIWLFLSNGNILTSNIADSNRYGIYLKSSNNNILTSNTANSNDYYGIYLYASDSNTLNSNTADSNSQYGIYLYASDSNTLNSNTADSNRDGIYLESSSNFNTLENNIANLNSRYGITLYSSNNNMLTNNNADSNSAYGIYLGNSSDNTLSSNTADSNHNGIHISSSNLNTLESNTANSNSNGIYFSYSNNNTLTSNNASSNGNGIVLHQSLSNTFNSNTVNSNRIGFYHSSNSNFNTYNSNTVNSNSLYGILIQISSNNTLINNIVNSNGENGFVLAISNSNILINNTANNNQRGIFLSSSNLNTLESNTANSNSQYGIRISSSNNNLIYNNFFNNSNNSFDNGVNFWNITKTPGTNIIGGPFLGGNFWHDYAGEDLNGDGLGDTLLPYNSNGGIVNGGDWLPLVVPGVGNSPPVLDLIGNQTVNENETLIIDVNATDPENDTLTFGTNAGEVLQSPFSFDSQTGLFEWTPTFNDSGNYSVTFNVTDGQLWDEETITIMVIDVQITCTLPISGMRITEDTILCPGVYNLPDGISIGADNITLDCDGATLNGSNSGFGILTTRDDVEIKNCNVKNYNTGIVVLSNNRTIVHNNNAYLNGEEGISLSATQNSLIINNNASANGVGIRLTFSDNNLISNNTLTYEGQGIYLSQSSDANIITDNIIASNAHGIRLNSARFNIVSNNIVDSNNIGMLLSFDSGFNNFSDNHVSSNSVGFYLDSSHNNSITNNNITANSNGITFLGSASDNLIYNNLFNNANNADDNGVNFWNITKTLGTNIIGGPFLGGNFWHDYTGQDLNGDGLGDTNLPYNSNGNIQNGGDFLPLTEVNSPPVLDPIGNKTVTLYQTLIFNVNATDPENDPLTFYTNANIILPGQVSFDGQTGSFNWTAQLDPDVTEDAAEYRFLVMFNVTDGKLWDEEEIIITLFNV